MKTQKIAIIYVSPISQNKNINWSLNTAKSFSSFSKVVQFSVTDKSLSWKSFFTDPFHFITLLVDNFSLLTQDFVHWTFFDLFPLERFKTIKRINFNFNLRIIKYILKLSRRQIILITTSPTNISENIYNIIEPKLTIGDCIDIWSPENSRIISSFADCLITNAQNLKNELKKYHSRVFQIGAGYFPLNIIRKIYQKNYYERSSKTILYIGNITWRVNLKLINYLLKELPDYKMIMIGRESFENLGYEEWWNKLNEETKIRWQKLKNNPNLVFIEMFELQDLFRKNIKASVGIVPLDINFDLNKYTIPIKSYFYFLMGIPIVSTRAEGLYNCGFSKIYFADNYQQFVNLVKKAEKVQVSQKEKTKMFNFVRQQTFEKKAQDVKRIIFSELKLKYQQK